MYKYYTEVGKYSNRCYINYYALKKNTNIQNLQILRALKVVLDSKIKILRILLQ